MILRRYLRVAGGGGGRDFHGLQDPCPWPVSGWGGGGERRGGRSTAQLIRISRIRVLEKIYISRQPKNWFSEFVRIRYDFLYQNFDE